MQDTAGRRGRWRGIWDRLGMIVGRSRAMIILASVVWLLLRSGTQPRRLAYPCQQAAAGNLGLFAALFLPVRHHRACPRAAGAGTKRRGSATVAGLIFAGAAAVIVGGTAAFAPRALYTPGNPAVIAWTPTDVSSQEEVSTRLLVPSSREAIVAINRNSSVGYGVEPYGAGANTAYELIWQTVADLHLGPAANPLADWLADMNGDGQIKVLIKPNTVYYFPDRDGERSPCYSHPATIRPLIDMVARAGATQIWVGDGSEDTAANWTNKLNQMGYTGGYFDALRAANPGVAIDLVSFMDLSKWRWVSLGTQPGRASAYVGSWYAYYDLAKGHGASAYFSTADPHGGAGPTRDFCVGWLAISDYLLDADAVINLAKLKVHYLSPNTAVLKNWVGTTMYSTYDYSKQTTCRVSHTKSSPSSYENNWGNDVLWRELVDAHRATLYWRDGGVYVNPQRRYLCVLDAINCGERYHVPNEPSHYRLNSVLASVDPVAIDAVGSRLQRYDFRRIPIINNAHAASIDSTWPLGTADPGRVRLVGSTAIDGTYNRRFIYDTSGGDPLWPDWLASSVNDLTPPAIGAVNAVHLGGGTWRITATVTDAHAVYYSFGDRQGSAPRAVRLARTGNTFQATVVGASGRGTLVAQDAWFNTARAVVNRVAPDLDGDGDVDGADYGLFSDCFNGAGQAVSSACEPADFDGDRAVDGADYGVFSACFNGSGNPPACPS